MKNYYYYFIVSLDGGCYLDHVYLNDYGEYTREAIDYEGQFPEDEYYGFGASGRLETARQTAQELANDYRTSIRVSAVEWWVDAIGNMGSRDINLFSVDPDPEEEEEEGQ